MTRVNNFRLITMIVFSVFTVSLLSCKGSRNGFVYSPPEGDTTGDPNFPTCSFVIADENGNFIMSGTTPHTFRIYVDIGGVSKLDSKGAPIVSLIEVDFSDGTGWHDYTTETLEFYRDERVWADLPTYTLTEPGEYFVHVRVTFPDGDVIDNEDVFPTSTQTITVLPPDEGEGA